MQQIQTSFIKRTRSDATISHTKSKLDQFSAKSFYYGAVSMIRSVEDAIRWYLIEISDLIE